MGNDMNKTQQRYGTMLRIYDNGGKTLDRYTVIAPKHDYNYKDGLYWMALGIDESALGFAQWVTATPGKHLGRRIQWDNLSDNVKLYIKSQMPEYFN